MSKPFLPLAICLFFNKWFSALYFVVEIIIFIHKGCGNYVCVRTMRVFCFAYCTFANCKFIAPRCVGRPVSSLSSVRVHMGGNIFSGLLACGISTNIFGFVPSVKSDMFVQKNPTFANLRAAVPSPILLHSNVRPRQQGEYDATSRTHYHIDDRFGACCTAFNILSILSDLRVSVIGWRNCFLSNFSNAIRIWNGFLCLQVSHSRHASELLHLLFHWLLRITIRAPLQFCWMLLWQQMKHVWNIVSM